MAESSDKKGLFKTSSAPSLNKESGQKNPKLNLMDKNATGSSDKASRLATMKRRMTKS